MAPASIVHLPNGQTLTVSPVFGGLYFKSNDLSVHQAPFPPGWTIVINSEDKYDDELPSYAAPKGDGELEETFRRSKRTLIHRFTKPTLHNDHLFISSISNPSSNEFKPSSSPTRQIAMMLWATLCWYFHQPEPDLRITNARSKHTADEGKPRGDWRININREGIFKGRVILQKLERMGLIATEDSTVGTNPDERSGEGWTSMFVSRRSFWQIDPRIYLFTLSPTSNSPFPAGTPLSSRPGSPEGRGKDRAIDHSPVPEQLSTAFISAGTVGFSGPFHSTSHLPTYYPPAPPQYIYTQDVRHPIRSKPPRQGETFYTRYVPSVGQYLSFRIASFSPKAPIYHGPFTTPKLKATALSASPSLSDSAIPTVHAIPLGRDSPREGAHSPPTASDLELLHRWMNDPRVAHSWGEQGPVSHQEAFLKRALSSKHSFPVIGCWDGKPFGYFEIYWVKEDALGRRLGNANDWDRGIHCLVGEQEFRGESRVRCWLSALVHWCWLADLRTEAVVMEPRIDNEKLIKYALDMGFYKEREVMFPHKQSYLLKILRDTWDAPAL